MAGVVFEEAAIATNGITVFALSKIGVRDAQICEASEHAVGKLALDDTEALDGFRLHAP